MEKKMLTAIEVSDMYSISVRTLRLWREKRIGPRYFRKGHTVRYPVKHLEEFIEEKTFKTFDMNMDELG